jgi:hypothetical protein
MKVDALVFDLGGVHDRAYFAHLRSALGLQRLSDELAFFDDVEANVAGARRAGLQAHQVTRPDQIAAISEALLQNRQPLTEPKYHRCPIGAVAFLESLRLMLLAAVF